MTREPLWRLAACPLVAWASGLAYTFGSSRRTGGVSFDIAKDMLPIQAWGLVFLVQAVFATVALAAETASLMAAAMFTGGTLYLWWAVCFALQSVSNPQASLVAWAPYCFVVLLHYTTASRLWSGRRRQSTS